MEPVLIDKLLEPHCQDRLVSKPTAQGKSVNPVMKSLIESIGSKGLQLHIFIRPVGDLIANKTTIHAN